MPGEVREVVCWQVWYRQHWTLTPSRTTCQRGEEPEHCQTWRLQWGQTSGGSGLMTWRSPQGSFGLARQYRTPLSLDLDQHQRTQTVLQRIPVHTCGGCGSTTDPCQVLSRSVGGTSQKGAFWNSKAANKTPKGATCCGFDFGRIASSSHSTSGTTAHSLSMPVLPLRPWMSVPPGNRRRVNQSGIDTPPFPPFRSTMVETLEDSCGYVFDNASAPAAS